MALLMLGRVLSLAQGPEAKLLPSGALVMIVVVLAISGIASLSIAIKVVSAHAVGRPARPRGRYYNQLAMVTLGMGGAIFLTVWLDMMPRGRAARA